MTEHTSGPAATSGNDDADFGASLSEARFINRSLAAALEREKLARFEETARLVDEFEARMARNPPSAADAIARQSALEDALTEATTQVAALRDRLRRLESNGGPGPDRALSEINRLRDALEAARTENTALIGERDAILSSTSWRMTRPFRAIINRVTGRARG